MLMFISGGVRSGKSTFAEQLALQMNEGNARPIYYIATSLSYDKEMNDRIKKHQSDRRNSGYHWRTLEQPNKLHLLQDQFTTNDVILIDCLTTLLSNELFSSDCNWQDEKATDDLLQTLKATFQAYKQKTKATIIVSNEIFNSGVPTDQGSFNYMKALGNLHQYITGIADQAYLVEWGIPRIMKEGK